MGPAFKILLCICSLLVVVINGDMSEGLYRIENVSDKLHITTEGANTAFAKVVGENWQNFGEQRWRLVKAGPGVYNLMPEKHSTNNKMSYYLEPGRKHALPERWNLISVKTGLQIQNLRNGLCLASSGRRKEILEGVCDKYLQDRHWNFISV